MTSQSKKKEQQQQKKPSLRSFTGPQCGNRKLILLQCIGVVGPKVLEIVLYKRPEWFNCFRPCWAARTSSQHLFSPSKRLLPFRLGYWGFCFHSQCILKMKNINRKKKIKHSRQIIKKKIFQDESGYRHISEVSNNVMKFWKKKTRLMIIFIDQHFFC